MGAIWLNNIQPGGVHMFCMQPPLVVCFDISSDESQTFLALFVIVFMSDDQLRLLMIVTPRYFAFSVVLRVVS